MNTSTVTLSAGDLSFYHAQGYLHAPGVVAPAALQLARAVLERWVDETILQWQRAGLLSDPLREFDFGHRLVAAWESAGRPKYQRSPRRDLVSREMFEFLRHPSIVGIAADLLGTQEVSAHGIFNARPKLPDQQWTDTPWHQDAQYYRDGAEGHIVSIWMPLQPVSEANSCLQVVPKLQNALLHEDYLDSTGFIGLSPQAAAGLRGVSIEMQPGDALCFPQKTPHRALPNHTDAVRWSMDVRYEATPNATMSGKKQGFIVRSKADPASEMTYEAWLQKWDSIPVGSY